MTTRMRNECQHLPRRWLTAWLSAALLTVVLPPAMTAAQDGGTVMRMERLQVDHRDPSRVREALLPLLSGRESIGVIGDWLIVAATDGTRDRIRERLEALDSPARRLEMTLSFRVPDETVDTNGGPATGPDVIQRELTLEPARTIRLNVPPDAAVTADDGSSEEAPRQLSLQVMISGRQMHMDYALHPANEPVDPVDGTRETLQNDTWHSLTDVIDVRVRRQY